MSENFTRFVEKKKPENFFYEFFKSGQICCHFGTPFAEHDDSDCSSGVLQY